MSFFKRFCFRYGFHCFCLIMAGALCVSLSPSVLMLTYCPIHIHTHLFWKECFGNDIPPWWSAIRLLLCAEILKWNRKKRKQQTFHIFHSILDSFGLCVLCIFVFSLRRFSVCFCFILRNIILEQPYIHPSIYLCVFIYNGSNILHGILYILL